MKKLRIIFLFFPFFISGCTAVKKISIPSQASLRFIGQYTLPHNLPFKDTHVGGLSGIDYDKAKDVYYLISDDSRENQARYYQAKIALHSSGIDSVSFFEVVFLHKNKIIDAESIRYNSLHNEIAWSSEGLRIMNSKDTLLQDPGVYIIKDSGVSDSLQLPAKLKMQKFEAGPRKNSVLEALTYADNYQSLFICTEEPLYEDGPGASLLDTKSYVRLYKFDADSKINTAQYPYKLDPVAHASNPPGSFSINGVSEMLHIEFNRFCMVERSFSTGNPRNTIKVFDCDISGATDIRPVFSLQSAVNFTPASKKLLLNMDDLKIHIDNIEGVTFGPLLPNGNKTLLFLADNNFSPAQRSQLLLFEWIEK